MSRRVHEYSVTILEKHLDTFGHVNNAAYLSLFEEARWDWITASGFGLLEIKQRGQGPTILECTVKFVRELVNRESIVIRSWGECYVGKIATVRQDMVRNQDQVCASAEFTVGLFDVRARKLIDPTDEWLHAVGWSNSDWTPKG